MAACADAAALVWIWNTIISFLFLAEGVTRRLTFNCFACDATVVNRIVVFVKFITIRSVKIAAAVPAQKAHSPPQHNAPEPQKKVPDVETERPIQVEGVICIRK